MFPRSLGRNGRRLVSQLYYGDNLDVLRDHIGSESIDLIYLDPPFNSNSGYNVLFKAASGAAADASIEAFDDTWTWGEASKNALLDIERDQPKTSSNDAGHA